MGAYSKTSRRAVYKSVETKGGGQRVSSTSLTVWGNKILRSCRYRCAAGASSDLPTCLPSPRNTSVPDSCAPLKSPDPRMPLHRSASTLKCSPPWNQKGESRGSPCSQPPMKQGKAHEKNRAADNTHENAMDIRASVNGYTRKVAKFDTHRTTRHS